MTLIIYMRCLDGSILISDRKESLGTGYGNEVKKIHVSRRDFVLTGAGEGVTIDFIFDRLNSDDSVTGEKVTGNLRALLSKYFEGYSAVQGDAACILVTWQKERFVPYEVKITGGQPSVIHLAARHRCIGVSAAEVIANYLLRRISYINLPWKVAVPSVLAVMTEVAKEVDVVGRLEEYGFDIVVFTDKGELYVCENIRELSPSIGIRIEAIQDISSRFSKYRMSGD